ncbi:ISKra4 family transposase, partial [Coraliomargarita sp. SDUM461003]|nr:ISKra4 family transposase [Coraliomargarita sp. SDUM461003]
IGRIWAQCTKESGRGKDSFVHVVGDGATWIEQQARSELNADRILLDFYHVCDYLGAAREHCASNSRWMTTQKNRLKRNRSDLVIAELASHLEPKHLPDEDAPTRCA